MHITNIISNGINNSTVNVLLVITFNPQVAGNILPAFINMFGNILTGNIIPDNISDGRNNSCDIIVSFDVVFIYTPSTVPSDNDTNRNDASDMKYITKLVGTVAPNIIGAAKNIIILTINRCMNADIKLITAPSQSGIFPTLYAFLISLLYNSISDIGVPSNDPIVIAKILIVCTKLSLAAGFVDMNIDPINAKKISGTT
jgi:hypothetical protein